MKDVERVEMELTVRTRSHLRYTEFLHEVLRRLEKDLDIEESRGDWLALSLREAVNNAVIHGNKGDPEKWLEVEFIVAESKLTIKVWDEGEGFAPEGLEDPTSPENLYKPRGRGVFLIRKFVDEVRFSRDPEGRFGVIMAIGLGLEPEKEEKDD